MLSFLLSILSAILLSLSQPPVDAWLVAWFALAPLFGALNGKTYRRAFALAYVCGVIYFSITLYWFVHVTIPGAILLILFLALYFALFGVWFIFLRRQSLAVRLLGYAAGWTVLEFIRANFLSGFGWVTVGHSQYNNLSVLQLADITGVYGISFLVVLVNAVLYFWARRMQHGRALKMASAIVVTLLTAVVVYGEHRLAHTHPESYVTIAVVQPDVSQDDKWVPSKRASIVQSHMDMTRKVLSGKPDLIVWPETSFPGLIWESPELFEAIKDFAAEIRSPLLVGAITDDGDHYFNSALLIGSDGVIKEHYDKIHLVPFGEYIPLRKYVPFLEEYIPIADFTSGDEYTVFQVPGPPSHPGPRFSVLICFEDTLGYLARRFVRQGAQFLVNMTNDGWFGASKEPLLHLQASVFRAVENRRALVRAANTGVSGVIDLSGRVQKTIADDTGRTVKVRGVLTAVVPVSSLETMYTKWGDFFTYLCFACILGIFVTTILFKKTGPDHVRD